MATRNCKYSSLRQKLDDLGYNEPLSLQSVDLVESLLLDLIAYRNKFIRFKEIATEALRRLLDIEESVGPLKEEHNQLLRENELLRSEISHTKERYDKDLKGLKNHVAELESAYNDLELRNTERIARIGELEEEILMQNERLMKYEGMPHNELITKTGNSKSNMKNLVSSKGKKQEKNGHHQLNTISSINNYLSDIMSHKSTHPLLKELEKLKSENAKLSQSLDNYKIEIKSRDEQIIKLIDQNKANSTKNVLPCRCHALELDDECLLLNDSNISSKFDELTKKLQSSLNFTLPSAEKVNQREKMLKEHLNDNNKNENVCICRKLKDVFENCKCGRNPSEPSFYSKLTLKINKMLEMLEDLSTENKNLRQKLEETESKDLNDKNEMLIERCDELTGQISSLREENNNLRKAQLPQKTPKPLSGKTVAFKSSAGNTGLESKSSPSSISSTLLNSTKNPLDDETSLRICCQHLKDEIMLLRAKNNALKDNIASLKSIIESFQSIRINTESISGDTSEGRVKSKGKTNSSSSKIEDKIVSNIDNMKNVILKELNCMCKEIGSPVIVSVRDFDEKLKAIAAEIVALRSVCENFSKDCHTMQEKGTHDDANEKIKALTTEMLAIRRERDYYSKEFYTLLEKVSTGIHDTFHNHETDGPSVKVANQYLEDNVFSLQQKVFELQRSLNDERLCFNTEKLKLEEAIKFHVMEKNKAWRRRDELMTKIQYLESNVDDLNRKMHTILSESSILQTQYNSLRSVNEYLEMSLKNAEAFHQKSEHELNLALHQIKNLEDKNQELLAEISSARKEIKESNDKILMVVRDHDELLEVLETKAASVLKLEKEKKQHLCNIYMLEQEISRLNCQLISINYSRSRNEEVGAERDIEHVKKELVLCRDERNKLAAENRILQSDLEALVKDSELRSHENENYKKEIEKLKKQVLNYVQEVQRVEEILVAKETEREEMLEHLKTLSAEAMNLDSNNQTLESEKKWTSMNLRAAQGKLNDLQEAVQHKDSIVSDQEQQIMQLSNEVQLLKNDFSNLQMENSRLQHEVETSKNLIKTLDYTKQNYEKEIHSLEDQVQQANSEMNHTQAMRDMLASQLEEQNQLIANLESTVSKSRKEALEQSLQNFSITQKIEELEKAVDHLQQELKSVNNSLKKCKETCKEYKEENIKLKRKLVNVQYEKVKAEEARSYSTSL